MIVVDASAVVDVLAEKDGDSKLRARLRDAGSLHAPHLLDTEVQHALRGLVAGRKITPGRAQDALADLDDLQLHRYPAFPLSDRVWDLRSNLSSYDATYVALAEHLGCPLVTCDRKLARGVKVARVEVF